jgi:hypothetical protein
MENPYKHPFSSNLMNEELLSRSSDNIATLLQIVLLHEQNLARLSRRRQEANPLGDLINIVLNNENLRARNREEEPMYSEHRYSDLISPIYTECPITQEPFEAADQVVMVRQCRHLFRRIPFHEWIAINQTCPYCRCPL